ncbi:putative ribosomal protein N-acetyltransferase [Vibrio sinaloensis DSM 21326]|uniref:Putative ribosomal protein N-acetyltransferase n=1 Tax=Vibrio sinaloensis DSM 21326 TaxID=945550 RepID=E8M681_PHOS4|nr:GNAT family N-acetyltransferase [Vibrio sinaloensis]EGA70531.1 putative ribosomal protein N-acetyltransferase [Vibrio sinaloensis DSM 21326]
MESRRLLLSPPSLLLADQMYQVIDESRSEFSQFLPWVTESLTKSDLIDNIELAVENYNQFCGEFWFNIVEKKSRVFIGAIGFIVRDPCVPYFEIGYWLQTSKTGLGYISEAIELVEQYAFIEKQAKRVEIKMAASNEKSQSVAQRCGYLLEGRLASARRLPSGMLDDTLIYAKTEISRRSREL